MRKYIPVLLCFISTTCLAEVVVISHPTLRADNVTRKEIERLYCGRTRSLTNGTRLMPLDQKIGAESRAQFYETILGKTPVDIKIQRSRKVFSGFVRPLKQYKNDAALKAFVASEPGYVGYIDKSQVDETVKVIYPVQPQQAESVEPEIEVEIEDPQSVQDP